MKPPRWCETNFWDFVLFVARQGEKAADVALTWDANQTCTDRAALVETPAHLVATKEDICRG